jgi:hypothetical protein
VELDLTARQGVRSTTYPIPLSSVSLCDSKRQPAGPCWRLKHCLQRPFDIRRSKAESQYLAFLTIPPNRQPSATWQQLKAYTLFNMDSSITYHRQKSRAKLIMPSATL